MSRTRRRAARPAPRRWVLPAGILVVVAVVAAVLMIRSQNDEADLARPASAPPFDAARAFAYVERQVAFGPRVPGTPAHDSTRAWLVRTFEPLADQVVEQDVVVPLATGDTLRGTNIVASWRPEARRRIMLSAHWDTRPVADNDPDVSRRSEPVLGANDGGSGVAVLLEMAHLFDEYGVPGEGGLDVVLFDLEDLGTIGEAMPDSLRVPFALGSAAFVRDNPTYRPVWGLLLDMVGDTDLVIPREGYSAEYAPEVVSRVWAAAARLGASAFEDRVGPPIEDDHVPFLRAGIPVANLIHVPFPETWHTTRDTPEFMSASSLGQVGQVVAEVLWSGPAP